MSVLHVVDDDAAIRRAVATLAGSIGMRCIPHTDGRCFLDQFDADEGGLVLMDVRMPGLSGMQVLEQIMARRTPTAVVMMSGYGEIRDAMRAIRLGAVDFLEKPLSPSVLLDSVQQAAEVLRQRQAHLDRVGDVQARLACLTERERQVMDSVVAGQPNKITAAELGLSRRTVECHRSRVMQKMDAESVPDLIRKVLLCDDADASSQADGSDARSGINRRVG